MVVGQLGKLRDGCQPSRGPIDNRPAGYQSGYQPAPQADDSSRGQTSRKRSWRLPGCYGASEATRNAALEFGGFERQPILAAAGSQPAMAECEDSHAPRKAVSEGGCGQDCPPHDRWQWVSCNTAHLQSCSNDGTVFACMPNGLLGRGSLRLITCDLSRQWPTRSAPVPKQSPSHSIKSWGFRSLRN